MGHSFVHQPYESGYSLQNFFDQAANDTCLRDLDVVVAWVKRSGVTVLKPSLEALNERGGDLRFIVGISQGGTSELGLRELLTLTDLVYVFHVGGVTFHPKLYVASGESTALILVGSHNFTAGGAGNNFEAGILSTLDLTDPTDVEYLDSLRQYVDQLIADTDVCHKLDEAFLTELIENDRYPLLNEDEDRSDTDTEPMDGEGAATEQEPNGEPLFGKSKIKLRRARYSAGAGSDAGSSSGTTSSGDSPGDSAGLEGSDDGADSAEVLRRWYKTLGVADAQQLATGHPSNTMTLVQAGHPINFRTYFRKTFFADEAWGKTVTFTGKPREVANVSFHVTVRGHTWGTHELTIRHTPEYESGQGNRVTELVWDEELGTYLRGHSHVGDTATLEKYADGTYRLLIDPLPRGPFVR